MQPLPPRLHFCGRPARAWASLAIAFLPALAQAPPLADLSLEELGGIDITSVARRPQRLSEAPAAVFVITGEDIRRSGATTLPEALRLAPNLQVARLDASQYAIGTRGLNTSTENKFLVLIDGRSVYDPINSGVYWDVQDTLLEDVERIEIISGPGGTLWGSNAVNGVINVITKDARDSQGTLGSLGLGTEERAQGEARFGGAQGGGAYRVYAKYLERDAALANATHTSAFDSWHRIQGGFRIDWDATGDHWTLQGDGYKGLVDQPGATPDKTFQGANVLGRWRRSLSGGGSLQTQLYFDQTRRKQLSPLARGLDLARDTWDLELQHNVHLGDRHEVVWGGGYRSAQERIRGNTAAVAFLPADKELRLANLFAQDSIALAGEDLVLTLGTKVEHNVYTGREWQPSARVAWKRRKNQLLWAALSRAVRTPSRVDRDFYVQTPGLVLRGGPNFRSEALVAYEAGYRAQAGPRVSFSASAYYNDYQDIRTLEQGSARVIANQMDGHVYGAELWGEVVVTEGWHLRPGYALLRENLRLRPGSTAFRGISSAGNDARHRLLLGSVLSLGPRVEFDGILRHLSALPDPAVPAYTTLDARLGWKPRRGLEFSLVGQNLFSRRHLEFSASGPPSEILRGGLLKVAWTF